VVGDEGHAAGGGDVLDARHLDAPPALVEEIEDRAPARVVLRRVAELVHLLRAVAHRHAAPLAQVELALEQLARGPPRRPRRARGRAPGRRRRARSRSAIRSRIGFACSSRAAARSWSRRASRSRISSSTLGHRRRRERRRRLERRRRGVGLHHGGRLGRLRDVVPDGLLVDGGLRDVRQRRRRRDHRRAAALAGPFAGAFERRGAFGASEARGAFGCSDRLGFAAAFFAPPGAGVFWGASKRRRRVRRGRRRVLVGPSLRLRGWAKCGGGGRRGGSARPRGRAPPRGW
jgi:hypothetical protein